jgi:hypothetical protein
MNSVFDQAESTLKKSIKSDIDELENTTKSMAERGKTNNEFADAEAAFLKQVDKTKEAANQRCEDVKKLITARRPSSNASEKEKEDYRRLLRYAEEGMKRLRTWIENIFIGLIDIVKQIVNWMWKEVVGIGTKIANAFKDVIDLLF